MESLKKLAEAADQAIRDLEIETRGASCLMAADDCIEMLNAIGEVTSEKEFARFCGEVWNCEAFKPAVLYGRPKEVLEVCIKASLIYGHLGVQMDVEIAPHHMYGARMSMQWKPLKRREMTPDAAVWEWQDLNNVSRIIIGHAVMSSGDRDCFSRWEFFK